MNPEELKLFKEEKPKYKIKTTGEVVDLDWLEKIISIYQERLKKLSEITQLTDFFFRDKLEYKKELLKWGEMSNKEIIVSLDRLEKILSKIKVEGWTKENLENALIPEAEKFAESLDRVGDKGYLLWPFRVALTGRETSAPPFEIAEILGKEKTIKRIKETRKFF